MTIIWTITQLDRQISDGFVTTAHWRVDAVDKNCSASIYDTCSWSEGTPVIPYDQLTQDIVLGWIWASGVDKDAAEKSLTQQIELQKNPVLTSGVPW